MRRNILTKNYYFIYTSNQVENICLKCNIICCRKSCLYKQLVRKWIEFLPARLKHNKYVEIKQFSKIDIKQNNVSTVILVSKLLVYNEFRAG